MKTLLLALCLFISSGVFAAPQKDTIISIDHLPPAGYVLDKGWKFHAGDNPEWGKPDFDDSNWSAINPSVDIYYLPQLREAEIGCFRLKLHINPSLINESLAFNLYQAGASEIYLNGRLIYSFGKVSKDYRTEKTEQLIDQPFTIRFDNQTTQVIAVRYSFNQKNFFINYWAANPCLKFTLNNADNAFANYKTDYESNTVKLDIIISLYLLLGLMSLFLYFSFRKQQLYFYFGIACLAGAIEFAFTLIAYSLTGLSTSLVSMLSFCSHIFGLIALIISFRFINILCEKSKGPSYYILIIYASFTIIALLFVYRWSAVISFFFFLLAYVEITRILLISLRKNPSGAAILVTTYSCVVLLEIVFLRELSIGNFQAAYTIGTIYLIIIPAGLSVFLASGYARTGRSLLARVIEVEQLSEKTIAQEQEKQQILANQNEQLERQVTERTAELNQSLTHLKATQTQLIQSEKMASLGELTAGIAHEIQNPLNFVNNFSEVNTELIGEMKQEIDKGDLEEIKAIATDIEENSKKISMHGKRADAIVKGMLQHSQSGTGTKEPIDLNALADECMRLSYHGLKAKDKKFDAEMITNLDESLPKVNVIQQDMVRVMLNLFNNAFYAVNQKQKTAGADYKPTVELETFFLPLQGVGGLKVKDNGVGIPDAIKEKIMQPFFTTKPTGEGTGLGLSLTYDMVVKGHGGNILVNSIAEGGSEFTVTLPL